MTTAPDPSDLVSDPHDRHAHHPPAQRRAFALAVVLNVLLVAAQALGGWWTGSIALIGDALHNATDVLGLVLAWSAGALAGRRPSRRLTYGYARSTILAALLNALLIVGAGLTLLWESVERIGGGTAPPAAVGMMLFALLGVVVNAGSAALFQSGAATDLNQRGAYLHLLTDAAVSVGVLLAGMLIALTGWWWVDPLTGLVIAAVILLVGGGLLRDALALSLDAVPAGIDPEALRRDLHSEPGVLGVHDLHIWPLSTSVTAVTVHLVHDGSRPPDELLTAVQRRLRDRHAIEHLTVQLERWSSTRA